MTPERRWRAIVARISEIEQRNSRSLREALLGDESAKERVRLAEQQIAELRPQLLAARAEVDAAAIAGGD
jgi:hypothetical protein